MCGYIAKAGKTLILYIPLTPAKAGAQTRLLVCLLPVSLDPRLRGDEREGGE